MYTFHYNVYIALSLRNTLSNHICKEINRYYSYTHKEGRYVCIEYIVYL